MNKSLVIVSLCLFFITSCIKKEDRLFYEIEGNWELQELSYLDYGGNLVVVDTFKTTLFFQNCKSIKNNEESHCDMQQTYHSDYVQSKYYASYGDKLNVALSEDDYSPLNYPLCIIGHHYVYDIVELDKEKLILNFPNSFYIGSDTMSNITYNFIKK